MLLFLSNEILYMNVTFPPMFPTQYTPDFFVADHYGLQNTTSRGS
jgi:hypothetical protein